MSYKSVLICSLLALTAALLTGPGNSQEALKIGDEPVAKFKELSDRRSIKFAGIPSVAEATDSLLINGVEVDPKFFPTVFRMTTGGTCTAALVGQAALLTAAHCLPHQSDITFTLGNKDIRGYCEHASGYSSSFNESEDWALCLLEYPVVGIKYETVATKVPPLGVAVHLTGYGCTKQDGPLDGKLRIGVSNTVSRSGTGLPSETSTIYTRSSIDAGGGAILCPGDSGGPLFSISGNSMTDARTIVGVNSRTTYEFGVSLFAATGSKAGQRFFRDWTERFEQEICGINTNKNCR